MIKKMMLGLSCLVLLMLTSCEKEETAAPTPDVAKTLCSPTRTVLGSDMIAELNAIANCSPTYCAFPTISTLQSPRFINPVDNSFYTFANSATISIADQTTILQAGRNYANANIPTGFHVSNIEFKASYLMYPLTGWFNVYVIVTYRKCR